MRLSYLLITGLLILSGLPASAKRKAPPPPPGIHLSIRPDKIHYAPGATVHLEGSVFNNTADTIDLQLRVSLITELTDHKTVDKLRLRVAPRKTETFSAKQKLGNIEYGYEVRLEAYNGSKKLPAARDWFTVSDNVWKVGIGGISGGPIHNSAPYKKEQIAGQMEKLRRNYCNWFEKQFWAPDDWGELTPETGAVWYSGQAARHESEANIRYQIQEAHKRGIKAISYGKCMAGGAPGWEMARARPNWFCTNSRGHTFGRPANAWDLDNWQKDKPGQEELNHYRDFTGCWTYRWVDLRRLDALDHGINEMIASTKQFGWDGFRFDSAGFAARFSDGKRRGHDAVNTRNMKRLKTKLWEASPDFLFGYNTNNPAARDGREYPKSPEDPIAQEIREMLAGGGLWMGEALREGVMRNGRVRYREWSKFAADEVRCIRTIKHYGGHFVYSYGLGKARNKDLYKFTLGTLMGAHQYTGAHAKVKWAADWGPFLTRWSGFLWDHRLKELPNTDKRVQVTADRELWYKDFANIRVVSPDRAFVIVHLLNPPPNDKITKSFELPPPVTGASVHLQLENGRKLKQVVFIAPGKPNVETELKAQVKGSNVAVKTPGFPIWGMLVYEISGSFTVPKEVPKFTPPLTKDQLSEIKRVCADPQIAVADRLPSPTPQHSSGLQIKPITAPKNIGTPPERVGGPKGLDVLVAVGHYHYVYDFQKIIRRSVSKARVTYCDWQRKKRGKGHEQLIPKTWEEIFKCDLIILVNLSATALGSERLTRLAEFVKAGGRVVVLGGNFTLGQGSFSGSPLEAVLPVKCRPAKDMYELAKPLAIGPASGKAYSGSPTMYYFNAVAPQADAKVLMWADKLPVLYQRNVGQGKTYVLAAAMHGESVNGETPFWASASWQKAFADAITKR